jgi:hypothetical protein
LAEVHRLLHQKQDANSAWELLKLIAPAATYTGSFEFTFDVMVEQVRVLNYLGERGKRGAEELYEHLQPLLRAARATRLEEELGQLLSSPPVLRARCGLDPRMPSGYSRMAMEALSAHKFGTPFTEGRSLFEAAKRRLSPAKAARPVERDKPEAKGVHKRERRARRKQRKRK